MPLTILLTIVMVRVFTIGLPDLIDPTESRYAFVAQEMVLSGDWVTPKLPLPEGIVPYLGKPPLHFWQTAVFMSIFGMDAWVSRIPSLLAWLLIGACAWIYARTFYSEKVALRAAVITLTSGLLFFLAGSSTIDVTFSAWITAALTSFALCAHAGEASPSLRTRYGYAFFIFSSLAFLTKGPAAAILIGLALFLWLCARDARAHFPRLPWVGGTLVSLALIVPWFIIAEIQNQGFLYYFFVQENFLRFVSRDYGDRFGTGHVYPRGSAVWMLLVAFLPWTPALLGVVVFSKEARQRLRNPSTWLRYAIFWGIAPTLFFSFARQLHAAYLIPGAAGLGVTLAVLIEEVPWPRFDQLFLYLRRVLLVISLGAFPVSLFLHAGWLAFPASLVFFILATRWMCKVSKQDGATLDSRVLLFAFSCAILYGVIFTLYSNHASRIKSGRKILSVIARTVNDPQQKAVFLSHNTYSLYYYVRDWQRQLGAPVSTGFKTLDQVIAHPPAHLIVNKSDIARMPDHLRQQYIEAAHQGKWKWLKKAAGSESPQP